MPSKKKVQVTDDVAMRHQITEADIRRIARKAGCLRINATVYPAFRRILIGGVLRYILHDAGLYMNHAKRSTVIAEDIAHGFERYGLRGLLSHRGRVSGLKKGAVTKERRVIHNYRKKKGLVPAK